MSHNPDELDQNDEVVAADEMEELDALLPAGTDDLFDLDQLLAESVSAKSDAKRIRDARKQLQNKTISAEDRAAMAAMVCEWEMKREWRATANTIMFEVQHCTHCGSSHRHFVGFFQQQEHKTSKISRWVKVAEDTSLPKVTKENTSYAEICAGCCEERGYGRLARLTPVEEVCYPEGWHEALKFDAALYEQATAEVQHG